jgi:hypothetical protein
MIVAIIIKFLIAFGLLIWVIYLFVEDCKYKKRIEKIKHDIDQIAEETRCGLNELNALKSNEKSSDNN